MTEHRVEKPGDFVAYIEGDNGERVPVTFIRSKMPPEVLKKIEQGAYPDVSMGCKVPYRICPLCSHREKKSG